MDPHTQKEVDRIADSISEISDEIESASEEGVPLEDIEGAKTLAAGLIDRYDRLLKRVTPDERKEVQKNLDQAFITIKGKLTQLKEAPE